MKARAAVLDAGNWTPLPIGTWALVAATLPTPWRPEVIHADLVWWSDRATPERPSFSVLAARWGVSKSAAHRIASAFDSVDGRPPVGRTGTTVGRPWDERGTTDKGSRPVSVSEWDDAGTMLGRCWDDAGTVPHQNDAKPMVFDGLQKQKTEAEDREEQEDRTHVPQGPAAPAALGPTDPTCDEPDWDALLTAVPLTYDEVDDDGATEAGPVDAPPSAADVAAGPAAVDGGALAPSPDAVLGALADGVRGDGAARPAPVLGDDGCLPLTATQPPPVTRATDVDVLWEAWRSYGTVRGRPNPKRRRLLERALEAHGLPAMLDLLAAAHGGADRYWRFLQGATTESDTTYLSPETLLNGRLDERVERAAAWVEAGRPTHDVAETRIEARAEVAVRSLTQRARDAWDKVVMPNRGSKSRFDAALAAFGTSEKADEARRAVLGGLSEAKGLSAIGMATEYTRPEKMRAFVRGFVAALGGSVTEAELREVG